MKVSLSPGSTVLHDVETGYRIVCENKKMAKEVMEAINSVERLEHDLMVSDETIDFLIKNIDDTTF